MAHPTLHADRPAFTRLACVRAFVLAMPLLLGGAALAQPAAPAAEPAAATSAAARHMIAEIQVIPRPAGTATDRYKHVDAAIAVIQSSGLRYQVHGLGTTIEGPPEKIWPLLQAVHDATITSGAERTLTIIKVSGGAHEGAPTVDDLTRKFRR